MASGLFVRFLSLVLLLVPATGARYLIEAATTTSPGLIGMGDLSPLPTDGPEWNGVPNELRRRAGSIISPPLSNWCGFIDGDYGESDIILLTPFRWNMNLFCQNLIFIDQPKTIQCLAGPLPRVFFKVATQNAAQT